MSPISIGVLAVSMSVDAFIASLGKGAATTRPSFRTALKTGAIFGMVEMITPLIGWAAGVAASQYVQAVDHWIAFALLGYIGGKMIWDAFHEAPESETCASESTLNLRELLMLAVATSIDALAVGITFAFLKVSILPAVLTIGCITFALSFVGVAVGNRFGTRFQKKAEIAGGTVLVLIGLKILLEHIGLL